MVIGSVWWPLYNIYIYIRGYLKPRNLQAMKVKKVNKARWSFSSVTGRHLAISLCHEAGHKDAQTNVAKGVAVTCRFWMSPSLAFGLREGVCWRNANGMWSRRIYFKHFQIMISRFFGSALCLCWTKYELRLSSNTLKSRDFSSVAPRMKLCGSAPSLWAVLLLCHMAAPMGGDRPIGRGVAMVRVVDSFRSSGFFPRFSSAW